MSSSASIRRQAGPNEDGLWFDFCKTAFKPYGVTVTAFLLIAKHHLGKQIVVRTDGEDAHWFDAKVFCMAGLGYGLEYRIQDGELEATRLA
ncbi:MAG: hypothetical protein IMF26_00075 [Candidatus Fermentithermobacillus carboniphilus]|uniref:Uncharacterized protein n=1 Tax=Candidatus Fermentithermobacillus carboniphilus TaxID=3085328 RepID=A0AAT9LBU4_9FIRM|nr:MAG: hypothetical protein IMF26_00075 [Candidatus Fermentithermobacillus carboniphilus]